jgi:pimeloyl-ACP methyl ester carboxylesterase
MNVALLTGTLIAAAAFGPIKQIDAGVLNIGYVEMGPAGGSPVVLLHGWPYDIHSYEEVAPLLASKGYRVIVPYLRGYGTTRFLSSETFRNAQQSAVALDIVKLMDAVTNVEAQKKPLPPLAEYGWWYQYYFATDRGRLGYTQNRHDFDKLIWKIASPDWKFDDAAYERTAAAFENPDHVDIVIHNYRWRLGLAKGEPQYDAYEQKLSARPPITVPAITIGSDFDGPFADGKAYASQFTGKHSHRVLKGIGHNVPQETPAAFAQAIVDVDGLSR